MTIKNNALIILMVLLAAACSPTDTGPAKVEMTELAGLWNSSEKIGMQNDVMYTRISANGDIIEYDFDGDEVDRGLNCYQIDSGSLKHTEANRYLITTDMHADKQFEVELEWLDAGQALKVYFLDSDDADGDGNYTETSKSQIWTREPDASILDNEPSCKK